MIFRLSRNSYLYIYISISWHIFSKIHNNILNKNKYFEFKKKFIIYLILNVLIFYLFYVEDSIYIFKYVIKKIHINVKKIHIMLILIWKSSVKI